MRNAFVHISLCDGDTGKMVSRRYFVDEALDYHNGVKEFHLMQMEDLFEDWEDFQRNTKILAERIAKAEGEQL
jgi:hypothetical protein